jgi:hypothetical protein
MKPGLEELKARKENSNFRYRSYGWNWKKIAGIYGISPTTAWRWSMS